MQSVEARAWSATARPAGYDDVKLCGSVPISSTFVVDRNLTNKAASVRDRTFPVLPSSVVGARTELRADSAVEPSRRISTQLAGIPMGADSSWFRSRRPRCGDPDKAVTAARSRPSASGRFAAQHCGHGRIHADVGHQRPFVDVVEVELLVARERGRPSTVDLPHAVMPASLAPLLEVRSH